METYLWSTSPSICPSTQATAHTAAKRQNYNWQRNEDPINDEINVHKLAALIEVPRALCLELYATVTTVLIASAQRSILSPSDHRPIHSNIDAIDCSEKAQSISTTCSCSTSDAVSKCPHDDEASLGCKQDEA